ncbi:hypothetical protein Sjap_007606 [Stephania japonica]|uniref:NAB domain-containing protein n=1 Tax=Stephania japonica TaxID=461633 RepID=A0AAP0JQA8_9MAGN
MLQFANSHSWWFDSDTGPQRSVWLQSTISELDEKIKTMLKLIEVDGDSFMQRAEMYYKRRPDLVTMVEDFYKMHRSLAEGFDQLKSEARNRLIKPFTPPILLKMEKPCDSYLGDSVEFEVHPDHDEHWHSCVGAEDEDYAESEVDDPEVDDPEQENDTNVCGLQMGNEESEDFDVDCCEQEHENPVAVERFSSIHRDVEVLALRAESEVVMLKDVIEKLKEENMVLKVQLQGTLSSLINGSEVAKLTDETVRLKVENVIHKDQLESSFLIHESEVAKLRDEIVCLKEENMILKEQEFSCSSLESEVAKLKDEIEKLKAVNMVQKVQLQGTLSSLIHGSEVAKLTDEIVRLKVENAIHNDQLESSCLIHESEVAKLTDEIERLKVEKVIHREQLESSCLIHESEVAKLRDEIARLKSENKTQEEQELDQSHGSIYENKVAKIMNEVENGTRENLTSGGEYSSLIVQSELAKLKDEMCTLKKENMIQKEQLSQKDEEKRQVIRQLSLSLDIMRENLSSSKKSIENNSSKKRTPFEFSKFKELFSPKKLFSGNSKFHQLDQSCPNQTTTIITTAPTKDPQKLNIPNEQFNEAGEDIAWRDPDGASAEKGPGVSISSGFGGLGFEGMVGVGSPFGDCVELPVLGVGNRGFSSFGAKFGDGEGRGGGFGFGFGRNAGAAEMVEEANLRCVERESDGEALKAR